MWSMNSNGQWLYSNTGVQQQGATTSPSTAQISSFVSGILGDQSKTDADRAYSINQFAGQFGLTRDQLSSATGYGIDMVNSYLGKYYDPNLVNQVKTAASSGDINQQRQLYGTLTGQGYTDQDISAMYGQTGLSGRLTEADFANLRAPAPAPAQTFTPSTPIQAPVPVATMAPAPAPQPQTVRQYDQNLINAVNQAAQSGNQQQQQELYRNLIGLGYNNDDINGMFQATGRGSLGQADFDMLSRVDNAAQGAQNGQPATVEGIFGMTKEDLGTMISDIVSKSGAQSEFVLGLVGQIQALTNELNSIKGQTIASGNSAESASSAVSEVAGQLKEAIQSFKDVAMAVGGSAPFRFIGNSQQGYGMGAGLYNYFNSDERDMASRTPNRGADGRVRGWGRSLVDF